MIIDYNTDDNTPYLIHQPSTEFPPVRMRRVHPVGGRFEHRDDITPKYPWTTERRAKVHSMQYLVANGIDRISGSVECKRCGKQFEMEYELQAKFEEVASFAESRREEEASLQRAPRKWIYPALPDCGLCGERNCVRPVTERKRDINWVFLFLGEMVGCCTINELKHFSKHSGMDKRTTVRDRLLYFVYMELLSQLDPHRLFHP